MSEAVYTLRRVEDGDAAPLTDLLVRVFGAGDEATSRRSINWWRWKYSANPAGHRSILAQDPEGRIVGFYGGVTLAVEADGAMIYFGQACDTCTDPRVRRGLKKPGLFVRIFQAYMSTAAPPGGDVVGYGLPLPDAYRMGARFLDYWMLRSQYFLVCTSPRRIPEADPTVAASSVREFPPEVDEFFAEARRGHRCIGRRNQAFLNWRFASHPERPYRMAVARDARDGGVRGYAVTRSGVLGGRSTGVIMDWLCRDDDRAAADSLLRWAATCAIEAGLTSLTFLCPTQSRWFERFQDYGFIVEPSPYVLVTRTIHPSFEPAFLREHWYYTQADFDLL